jgi:hypothetical protein
MCSILADHHPGLEQDATVVDDPGGKVRQVHPDLLDRAVMVHPALTLQRDDDRLQPRFRADVQLDDGAFPGRAIGSQAVADLKVQHGRLDAAIIERRGRGRQIAHPHQPVTQRHHGRAGIAGRK